VILFSKPPSAYGLDSHNPSNDFEMPMQAMVMPISFFSRFVFPFLAVLVFSVYGVFFWTAEGLLNFDVPPPLRLLPELAAPTHDLVPSFPFASALIDGSFN